MRDDDEHGRDVRFWSGEDSNSDENLTPGGEMGERTVSNEEEENMRMWEEGEEVVSRLGATALQSSHTQIA
jgi:hypothetical protein